MKMTKEWLKEHKVPFTICDWIHHNGLLGCSHVRLLDVLAKHEHIETWLGMARVTKHTGVLCTSMLFVSVVDGKVVDNIVDYSVWGNNMLCRGDSDVHWCWCCRYGVDDMPRWLRRHVLDQEATCDGELSVRGVPVATGSWLVEIDGRILVCSDAYFKRTYVLEEVV